MASENIKSSVLHGPRDLRLETRSIRPPNPSDVQVSVRTTGLCGSDLHYYNHFRNGDIQVLEPLSLGHESAGVVSAVGSEISNLKVGDKVALEVGLPCGSCEFCGEGRYNICPDMKFRSSAKAFPHAQGTLQERINHPGRYCWKLPEEMSLEMGALIEPLSVAIHANRRAGLKKGAKVLVFGAGAVGLLVAATVRMEGCEVIIADIDQGRIDFAVQNNFADQRLLVTTKRGSNVDENLEIAKQTAKEIGECNWGDGVPVGQVDAVFECTGVPSCLQASIYATKPGGKIMLIGMGTPIQTLPISAAALREVDIVGVFRYADTYPTGIEILSQRGPNIPKFDKLVTHRFQGFEQIEQAFQMAGKTKDDQGNLVLKVMLEVK